MAPPARLKAISPLCPRPGRGRRLFSGLKHPIDKRTETIQQTQKMTGQTSGNVQDNRGGSGVFETWAEHGPEQICRVRCVLRLPRKARVSHTRPPFTPSSYPHKFLECSARSPVHMSHVRTFIGACSVCWARPCFGLRGGSHPQLPSTCEPASSFGDAENQRKTFGNLRK